MTTQPFAPKDAETLKSEILEDLGIEYEGNEDTVDKLVARELKSEEFKASLHEDKVKHLEGKKTYEEILAKAGIDPKTGEKVAAKASEPETPRGDTLSAADIIAIQGMNEEDALWLIDEAKLRGKTVSEMKKDRYAQVILQTRTEERKTAEATATSSNRQSSSKSKGEDLLKRADENKLSPDEMREAARAMIASMK